MAARAAHGSESNKPDDNFSVAPDWDDQPSRLRDGIGHQGSATTVDISAATRKHGVGVIWIKRGARANRDLILFYSRCERRALLCAKWLKAPIEPRQRSMPAAKEEEQRLNNTDNSHCSPPPEEPEMSQEPRKPIGLRHLSRLAPRFTPRGRRRAITLAPPRLRGERGGGGGGAGRSRREE